jgi:hypothetical protein
MSYTVNRTDGTVVATISDGTIDTASTSITLIGKNYSGFGEALNEDLVALLENFSNTTSPSAPLEGQVWWDKTNNNLNVYDGTQWKNISSSTAAATAPSGPIVGDLWWDTTNAQLNVFDGSAWVIIGPSFTSAAGTSGAIVETIQDTGLADHVVVKNYVANTVVSIVSKDATFTPNSAIAGFTTIKPGHNMVADATISGARFHGDATNAELLGSLAASQFLRADQSDSTSGQLSILNDSGLIVGADSDITLALSGANATLTNTTLNGDFTIVTTDSGGADTMMSFDASTARIGVKNAAPTDTFHIGASSLASTLGVHNTTQHIKLRGSFADPLDYGIIDTDNTDLSVNIGYYDDSVTTKAYPLRVKFGAADDLVVLDSAVQQAIVKGGIVPETTATYSLGTASLVWNEIRGTTLFGTLSTAAQTNITSLGTLSSLTVSGTSTLQGLTDMQGSVNLGDATADVISFLGQVGTDIDPDTDNTWSLGASGLKFLEVWATTFQGVATSAQYADMAERFAADHIYAPGTIVKLGGEEEITMVTDASDDDVFGVISTNPAYMMNSAAGNDETHPYVALAGRVPVNVIGSIKKGDRLVSAGEGLAKAGVSADGDFTPWNVIGRALEDKNSIEVAPVMSIVRANIN